MLTFYPATVSSTSVRIVPAKGTWHCSPLLSVRYLFIKCLSNGFTFLLRIGYPPEGGKEIITGIDHLNIYAKSPKSRLTCSGSPSRIRPLSINTVLRRSPSALCPSIVTTDESTPPERALMAVPLPTAFFISPTFHYELRESRSSNLISLIICYLFN